MSCGEKNSLELLKQKAIFENFFNKSRFETNKLSQVIDFNNLTYLYKGKSAPKSFIRFKDPLVIYNDIKNARINLQKEEKIQDESQSELNEILNGNPNYKSEDQISTIKKIKTIYNGQQKLIKFYNDFTKMVYEAK